MSQGSEVNQAVWTPALSGRDRLVAVVAELGRTCVWTQSRQPADMLREIRSEITELEVEVQIETQRRAALGSQRLNQRFDHNLISELGDVLFDCLMLHGACCRAFEINPAVPWDAAAAKVEYRTPYMMWGDGVTTATTVEETQALWTAAKAIEKVTEKRGLPSPHRRQVSNAGECTPATSNLGPPWQFNYLTAMTFVGGFALGVVVCHFRGGTGLRT
eukprot:m.456853 g.456853  ORF g.456853 m.456853 type:complete len:217 (-) comp21131_c0_seq1:335-985(-)